MPAQQRRRGAAAAAAALLLGAIAPPAGATAIAPQPPAAPAGDTARISVDSRERQAAGASYAPAISADGRFVAFDSESGDLVPDDRNFRTDVFVRDRRQGVTTRVSVASTGTQGDAGSFTPVISGDGRYVAFVSDATNLVPGDTNAGPDVFLHDRRTRTTTRLSVALDGRELSGATSPSISRSGRFVVYNVGIPLRAIGTAEDFAGIFLYDTRTGRRERLPRIAGTDPTISADGRYVAFASEVRDLVEGDSNRTADAFVLDRRTGRITRVSLSSRERQANGESIGAVISANGRYVTFSSLATNLVPGDTNAQDDVFVRDLRKGVTRRVSVGPDGRQSDGVSGGAVPSANGRWVVFLSAATTLAPGRGGADFHLFRKDLRTGALARVNVDRRGNPADGESTSFPALSADGRTVAFGSSAANLVPGDTNGRDDIFVRRY